MPDPIVHGGLTRAQLDHELDNQRHVPDFRTTLAAYAERSAAARATLPCHLGVPYGPGARERLDIFLPTPGPRPAPVHLFLHGGAWRAMTKEDSAFGAPLLTAAGAVFVALEFDLATTHPLAAMVEQARAATAWMHAHAADYGADPARLTISGHSSGAHMGALVAVTDWTARGLPPDLVKGALLVSGLYDLEPVRLSYRNDLLKLDEAAAAALSPLHHRPPPGLRATVAGAADDTPSFRRQAAALDHAWGLPGVVEIPGRHHYDVALDLGDPATELGRRCLTLATE